MELLRMLYKPLDLYFIITKVCDMCFLLHNIANIECNKKNLIETTKLEKNLIDIDIENEIPQLQSSLLNLPKHLGIASQCPLVIWIKKKKTNFN